MAYLLGRAFTTISVEPDDDSLGRVSHAAPGAWFRPDIDASGRARRLIEHRVMILLAGAEAERAWLASLADVPNDWEELVTTGAAHDYSAAADLAGYACGSVPELEAYVEWLRQGVLGHTGRGADHDPSEYMQPVDPVIARRIRFGDERFWVLVTALADAVQEAGTLTWRQAQTVLRDADPAMRSWGQR